MMNLRLIAARIIDEVTDGRSLSDCLQPQLSKIKETRDRAFVQAICYGVCRFYSRLDVVLSHLMKKPMKAKDSDVHALLMVGLYQLMEMKTAEHAAVSETVSAVQALKKPWARGLVNAVLREYIRTKDSLGELIASDVEAQYAHPAWWISATKKAWPENWQDILTANNCHPPFSLRVNQQCLARTEYIEKLSANDLIAHELPATQSGLVVETPVNTDQLPGFGAGLVSVQDGAAQLAVDVLQLQPGMRVLDACAAPGGKLTHMMELQPDLKVIAVEKEQSRMLLIKENLQRLKLKAKCICADAADIDAWWDKKEFDRILLDAPCSASGVIRRHPDIKLLRLPTDIKTLTKLQQQILQALWPTLKSGGLLVYATCSVFPDENVDVVREFLAAHDDAEEEKIVADWGVECEVGRQILPGMQEMDGFYYAILRKV